MSSPSPPDIASFPGPPAMMLSSSLPERVSLAEPPLRLSKTFEGRQGQLEIRGNRLFANLRQVERHRRREGREIDGIDSAVRLAQIVVPREPSTAR